MTHVRPKLGILDPDTYANGDPTTFGLPLDQYDYLRENEPVYLQEFEDPLLIDRAWVLTRYDDISAVDRDPATFAADRGFVNVWRVTPVDPKNGGMPALLTYDGADHKRNRSALSKGFTPKVVASLKEKFHRYAVSIVDDALDKGTFNFVTDIAHAMPMEALGDVLGVPRDDREQFFSWVDTFAAPFDPRITPSFESVLMSMGSLMLYATELAEIKGREPAEDVMTQIAKAYATGQMSEDEVMGNVSILAAGAAESTRSALSHGMHELMRSPEQTTWVRERADDIPSTAIQEILRIATPFTHFVRTATKDVELHGVKIPEGDLVCMLFAAGNFDPRAFDQPRKFDLTRENNFHLTFGRGPHACLGKHVAGLEMKILLEELFKRTKSIEPAGPISYVRDNYSRGVYELPVTVTPA